MKTNLPINQRIGITECADPGLDFSWLDKLDEVAFSILITKHLNDRLIDEILKHKNKIILHTTITGMGGTLIEPGVQKSAVMFNQLYKLITLGFPTEQIIFRLDPVVPTTKGIQIATIMLKRLRVLNGMLKEKNIKGLTRVRYSFMDMYKHVETRFLEKGIPLPYGKGVFQAPKEMQENFYKAIEEFRNEFTFESCAEGTVDKVGCVSSKDIEYMNRTYGYKVILQGNAGQRKFCACPANKVQIIDFKSPFNCPSACAYCYWR